MLELWIYIYTLYLKYKEDAILMKKLDTFHDQMIKRNHLSYVYLRKLVILRREIRFIKVEILIYSARMILLTSALKLVGHQILDPIFVSVCGLIQAFAVVFKSMKSKKKFYQLDVEDIKEEAEKRITLAEADKFQLFDNNKNAFYEKRNYSIRSAGKGLSIIESSAK